MAAEDALLFIDANKYLDLYRIDNGKKLLAPLGEQARYIFVTQQIVDEVQRNKVSVAVQFFVQKFRALKLQTFSVPDHLLGSGPDAGRSVLKKMGQIVKAIDETNEEVDALALGIMEQISSSQDEVSAALAPIFAARVPHSPDELERARYRRELGNPPGKTNNSLGDQLTWEQILSRFKGKRRLWIISRDGDYGTSYGGKVFLNRFLQDELSDIVANPEIYAFADLVEGIDHFVRTTGVKAEKRLTPEDAKEVEEQERSLQQQTDTDEDAARVIAAMAGSAPADAVRRTLDEFTKIARPNDALQRWMDQVAKLTQPNDALQRAMDQVVKLTQPNDALQRAMDRVVKLTQPMDALQRAADQVLKLKQASDGGRRTSKQQERSISRTKKLRNRKKP